MKQEYRGYIISIEKDPDPQNPRTEYDNATVMALFHKRYRLGDNDHDYHTSDFGSWDAMRACIRRVEEPLAILPVYMYDHSGITISTKPFSCPWDSGQIGFAWITKVGLERIYGAMQFAPDDVAKLEDIIRQEVETYNRYLRGECYGYTILDDDGEEMDSCWGYDDEDYCLSEAKAVVDYRLKGDQDGKES